LLAIQALVGNMDTITGWLKALPNAKIPLPPDWVSSIPLIGTKVAEYWTEVAAGGTVELLTRLKPFMDDAARWLAVIAGSIGLLTLEFLLTVVIAAIMYANGEAAREGLIRLGRRLAGKRGESVVILAGQAIRAVALGVVVTALLPTILTGIGLAVAGVPFAGILTAVTLILCIAQIWPLVVLAGAIIWLYWSVNTLWGTLLLIWSLGIAPLDNVLRPILIRRGADLPLWLIFA